MTATLSATGPMAAIAIRRSRFSETSLMVTWFTEQGGKVRTSARGALRPSSPLAGRIDLFHETRIFWVASRRGDVHTLKEAEIILPFAPGEPAHLGVQAAAYFAELVAQCTQPEESHPEIYDLLRRGLGYLKKKPPSVPALHHFEKELARFLGIYEKERPAVDALRGYIGHLPPQRAELFSVLREGV
jgi:DNA repair protein RecO (recombination protein O)